MSTNCATSRIDNNSKQFCFEAPVTIDNVKTKQDGVDLINEIQEMNPDGVRCEIICKEINQNREDMTTCCPLDKINQNEVEFIANVLEETTQDAVDLPIIDPLLKEVNQKKVDITMNVPVLKTNQDRIDLTIIESVLEEKKQDSVDLTMIGPVLEETNKDGVDLTMIAPVLEETNQDDVDITMLGPVLEETNQDGVELTVIGTVLEETNQDGVDLTRIGPVLEETNQDKVDLIVNESVLEETNQNRIEHLIINNPLPGNQGGVDFARSEPVLEETNLDRVDLTMTEPVLSKTNKDGFEHIQNKTNWDNEEFKVNEPIYEAIDMIHMSEASKGIVVIDMCPEEGNSCETVASENNNSTLRTSLGTKVIDDHDDDLETAPIVIDDSPRKKTVTRKTIVQKSNKDIFFENENAEIFNATAKVMDQLKSEAIDKRNKGKEVSKDSNIGLGQKEAEDTAKKDNTARNKNKIVVFNENDKIERRMEMDGVIVVNDETESENTIVLDDDDDENLTVPEPIVIDDDAKDNDCSIVEASSSVITQGKVVSQDDLKYKELPRNKVNNVKDKVDQYDVIFQECPTLIELIEKCLNMENTSGMIRVINRTLLAIYKSVDDAYKKSIELRLLIMKTISHLDIEPEMKFSHIKNLCEELKLHKAKKKVPFITLETKKRKEKPPCVNNHVAKRKKLDSDLTLFIDLDDDDDKEELNNFQAKGKHSKDIDMSSNSNVAEQSKNTVDIPIEIATKEGLDTDNIPIHKEQTIEINDDSSSDIIIGDGNNSDNNEVILLDDISNKDKTQHEEIKDKSKVIKKLVVNISTADQNNAVKYRTANRLAEYLHIDPVHLRMDLKNNDYKKHRIICIEQNIAGLKKRIEHLEQQEVTATNSPYIQCEKLKLSIVKQYEELCRLTGTEVVKRHEVRLHVVQGHPVGPVRCLEKFLNDNIDENGNPPFPDLVDVIQCVCLANETYSMHWTRQQIMNEAHALFRHYGRTMQKRRQMREYKDLLSLVKEERVDPADEDPALQARLAENARIARKNEDDLLNRFAEMESGLIGQTDPGLRLSVEHSGDSDSEDPSQVARAIVDACTSEPTEETGVVNCEAVNAQDACELAEKNDGSVRIEMNAVDKQDVTGVQNTCKIGNWNIVSQPRGCMVIEPLVTTNNPDSFVTAFANFANTQSLNKNRVRNENHKKFCSLNQLRETIINSNKLQTNAETSITIPNKKGRSIGNGNEQSRKNDTFEPECGFQIFTHRTKNNNNSDTRKEMNITPLVEQSTRVIVGPPDVASVATSLNTFEVKIENDIVIENNLNETQIDLEPIIQTEPINVCMLENNMTCDKNTSKETCSKDSNKNAMEIETRGNEEIGDRLIAIETGANNEIVNSDVKTESLDIPSLLDKDALTPPDENTINEESLGLIKDNAVEIETEANNEIVDSVIETEPLDIQSMLDKGTITPLDETTNKQSSSDEKKDNAMETETLANPENVDSIVKPEPLDIPSMLEDLGENFTATVFDIEDPFMVIEISDSSDSEDEHT